MVAEQWDDSHQWEVVRLVACQLARNWAARGLLGRGSLRVVGGPTADPTIHMMVDSALAKEQRTGCTYVERARRGGLRMIITAAGRQEMI
jgi:hypothetical protein